MTKKTNKLPTLESSLAEISNLIEKMEQSDQTLEQSLSNFERGITLIKHCQHILNEAEQKVTLLMQANQTETLEPLKNNDDQTE